MKKAKGKKVWGVTEYDPLLHEIGDVVDKERELETPEESESSKRMLTNWYGEVVRANDEFVQDSNKVIKEYGLQNKIEERPIGEKRIDDSTKNRPWNKKARPKKKAIITSEHPWD